MVVGVTPGLTTVVGVGATAVVVVVVAGATPVSGDVQPAGAVDVPPWPGISRVPAQPKSENWASSVTVPPSEKATVEEDSRMKPEASTETRSRMVVNPCAVRRATALVMVLASALLTPGADASAVGSIASSYWVTLTPPTVEDPTSAAPLIAGCTRSR